MPDWFAQAKEKEARDKERWDKVREIAVKNGLVMVKMSARRYIVVSITAQDSVWAHSNCNRYTNLSGGIVCGPTNYNACRQYIADNTTAIPEDLCGQ